jgi:hypothetical protein
LIANNIFVHPERGNKGPLEYTNTFNCPVLLSLLLPA